MLEMEFAHPPAQRPDADASLDLLLDLLVEAAGLVHHVTGGHPYRATQLADAAWLRTEPGGSGEAAWAEAFREVRRNIAPGLEMLFSTFSHAEQVVLRALAISPSSTHC